MLENFICVFDFVEDFGGIVFYEFCMSVLFMFDDGVKYVVEVFDDFFFGFVESGLVGDLENVVVGV